MKVRTRLLSLAAALGAATIAATPVAAQTYDVDAYVYVNASVSSTGSITVLGQTVTWNISISAFVCAFVSLDNADPIIPEVGVCAGVGSANYVQVVCGTGMLSGTMDMSNGGDHDLITFTGPMVNWLATFTGTTSSGAPVTGMAHFIPSPGQSCATGITSLTATGQWSVG
jgi:hypothetical protein